MTKIFLAMIVLAGFANLASAHTCDVTQDPRYALVDGQPLRLINDWRKEGAFCRSTPQLQYGFTARNIDNNTTDIYLMDCNHGVFIDVIHDCPAEVEERFSNYNWAHRAKAPPVRKAHHHRGYSYSGEECGSTFRVLGLCH